jgi:hypothetical protein
MDPITVFCYWRDWISASSSSVEYFSKEVWNLPEDGYPPEVEGLVYCDGFHPTFWYVLNLPWYEMSNKHSARQSNKHVFQFDILQNVVDRF